MNEYGSKLWFISDGELDIFLENNEFSLRWEDGVRITKNGVKNYSKLEDEILIL